MKEWGKLHSEVEKQKFIQTTFQKWKDSVDELYTKLGKVNTRTMSNLTHVVEQVPPNFSEFKKIYGGEIRAMMESDEGRKLYYVLEKADPGKNRNIYDSVYSEFINYLATNPSAQQKIIEAQ